MLIALLFALTGHAEFAPVNGLQLYYEVHGQPKAGTVPLVLIHGGGSTLRTSFRKLIPQFAQDRLVIAFDQQGHGKTADIANRPFTFKQSADDAIALLKHLGHSKADFFGFSNGGHIAIQIGLDYPQHVEKLVIESAMATRAGAFRGFWDGFRGATIEQMPQALRDEYTATSPHPDQLPSFFKKSLERMKNFKGWSLAEMKKIQAPSLILLGDEDVITPEHGVQLFRTLPHAALGILPGVSHSTIEENPLVYSIVTEFLK